jgi:hypothetical protein
MLVEELEYQLQNHNIFNEFIRYYHFDYNKECKGHDY